MDLKRDSEDVATFHISTLLSQTMAYFAMINYQAFQDIFMGRHLIRS